MALSRRGFIAGLFAAAPVVIASSHLMPLRGIKFDPIVRVQSFPIGQSVTGPFWVQEGPLSMMTDVKRTMTEMFGRFHYAEVPEGRRGMALVPGDPFFKGRDSEMSKERAEFFGGGGFHIGVAHGVSRVDIPCPPEDEFLVSCRENITRWREKLEKEPDLLMRIIRDQDEAMFNQKRVWEERTQALIERSDALRTFGHPQAEEILRQAGFVI